MPALIGRISFRKPKSAAMQLQIPGAGTWGARLRRTMLTAILILPALAGPVVSATAPRTTGAADGRAVLVVVVGDRGAAGNAEVSAAIDALSDLPAKILFIGNDDQGVENGYRGEIAAARAFVERSGAERVILAPLFVMEDDPLLTRFRPVIEEALAAFRLTWTPALFDDYLLEEILLDRFRSAFPTGVRGNRALERSVARWLLLAGARDPVQARAWQARAESMAKRLARIADWPEAPAVAVLVSGESAAARAHNTALFARIADGKAPALVVPVTIGFKATAMMSLHHHLARRLDVPDIRLLPEIIPHPLIATHLRRMWNAAVPPNSPSKVGIVVMAHGATKPYNDLLRAWAARIFADRPWALALGMADPESIAAALSRLEAKGVRRAVFYRLFAYPWTFAQRADFIIGLRRDPPARRFGMNPPRRARTSLALVSGGGYMDDPDVAQILAERARDVSHDAQQEAVFVLSHGSGSDVTEKRQQAVIKIRLAEAGRLASPPFAAWHAMSLFEDWPAKRVNALAAIRAAFASERSRGRRILVVSPRLIGPGPIPRLLKGETFVLAGDGLLSHPLFARLVRNKVDRLTRRLIAEGRDVDGTEDKTTAGGGRVIFHQAPSHSKRTP